VQLLHDLGVPCMFKALLVHHCLPLYGSPRDLGVVKFTVVFL